MNNLLPSIITNRRFFMFTSCVILFLIIMNNKFVIAMYGRIRYQQYGEWRNLKYRELKYRYKSEVKFTSHCPVCKCRLHTRGKRTNYTIDHIIPLWVCRDYALPQLEFDSRNWRVMCKNCNIKRGSEELTIESLKLSEGLKKKILESKQIWYTGVN